MTQFSLLRVPEAAAVPALAQSGRIGAAIPGIKSTSPFAKSVDPSQKAIDPREALVRAVAQATGIAPRRILGSARDRDPVAQARQLAMYLMHVIYGLNLTEVGAFFHRDRTTVAHACARIEDRRDEPGFDAFVAGLEDRLTVLRPPRTAQGALR